MESILNNSNEEIAFQQITTSRLSRDGLSTPMGESDRATLVVLSLLIMPQARSLTSASSRTMHLKLWRASINLKVAREEGFKIKKYHSDNGVFAAQEFKDDYDKLDQKVDFSGVGAQHQNGVAERNIKTVAFWACANMLYVKYHWPQHTSIKLWPMAINYAVWVFNHLPQADTGLCPDEMWSKS